MFPFLVLYYIMTLVKSMQEGDKSPTLYSQYDKKYDFNQLQQDADREVYEYIASLKRGNKDTDQFIKAYSDIMAGIKDGSITFKDGKYIDTKGRYSNGIYYDDKNIKKSSNKPSKDYYGLMANYIYQKQNSQKEYIAPEDKTKIKWSGNTSVGQAITRHIFNSNTWNNEDFLDLNEYDESGNIKGTDNRYKKLYDAFDYVLNNFDNLFTGYSEQQKQDNIKYIQEAMDYLKDNQINSGDYLALNKAAGGLDYRNMFSDKKSSNESPQDTKTDFLSWVSKTYPIFKGTLRPTKDLNNIGNYGTFILNRLNNAINSLSDNDLCRIIFESLSDPNYTFDNENIVQSTFGNKDYLFPNALGVRLALQALKTKNLLQSFGEENPNLYYIPNTDHKNRQTAWVWNTDDNTISEMSYHDIPYWRQKIVSEYQKFSNNLSKSDQYFTSRYGSYKQGGILLAQQGIKTPSDQSKEFYSELQEVDPSIFTSDYDTSKLVNADFSDDNFDAWVSNVNGKSTGRYLPSKGNTQEYTSKIEEHPYYIQFGKDLIDENGNFTELGKAWAKLVDKNIPTGSLASFYDKNNKPRTSWTVTNKDIYNRKPNTFNKLSDYVNYVRNDKILGARHNVFLKTGKRYFYKDKNGIKHYVNPENINDYIISENPENIWDKDKLVNWSDYEITGKKSPDQIDPTDKQDSTNIYLKQQQDKQPADFSKIYNKIPDIINFGRLLGHIKNNNRITDIVKQTLTPVLQDTYELYSPVTGAFSEMQLGNNLAAEHRRKAANPFTSDARLQLAGMLEANKQSTDVQKQAFLADDAEIKRTKAEALKRQEDNIARRNKVANDNRAIINQNDREIAQLEAARLKNNQESIDNFLKGIEGRLITDKERKNDFKLQVGLSDINQKYQDVMSNIANKIQIWQNGEGKDKPISLMPGYDNYIKAVREAAKWKAAQYYKLHANVYNYDYTNPYLGKDLKTLVSQYKFKKGGILKPNVMYLINKVIKNESYT